MYSHVNLIGRITNEIRLETTSSGKPKVFFILQYRNLWIGKNHLLRQL